MCECFALTDEKLRHEFGAGLDGVFGPNNRHFRAVVLTFWLEKKRGQKRPPLLVATFCPFCGAKYEEAS